jgi:hypothetical protein
MKYLLLLLLIPAGCSTCHDGYYQPQWAGIPLGAATYSPCKSACCREDKPAPCGCSTLCPCWQKHASAERREAGRVY